MKFFESKYHVSIDTQTDNCAVASNQTLRDIISIKNHTHGNFQTTMAGLILGLFCSQAYSQLDMRLSWEKILEHCELVEDMRFSRNTVTGYDFDINDTTQLYDTVYFHEKSETFILLRPIEDSRYRSLRNIFIPHLADNTKLWQALHDDGIIEKFEPKITPLIYILSTKNGNLDLTRGKLDDVNIDFDTMYPESFKPVSKAMINAVGDSKLKGLMLLHGEPGTGKTNYLRWLSKTASRRMVFIPPHMVEQLSQPRFVEFLIENKGLTFIVEDAEFALAPRRGAERSVVSTILNLTDGLLGDILNCQFICTFNTDLSQIDSALLRPGRLLVQHEFNKLTVEQSNAYLESVGSDERVSEPSTLATLTNLKTKPVQGEVKAKPSFGFIGNQTKYCQDE